MKFASYLAVLALATGLSGGAHAQLLPFGGPQVPGGAPPQCTPAYRKSVEAQISGLERLRSAGPQLVGQVCTLIEGASALVGGELPDDVRGQIKSLLGVDVDLRFIKTQCRISQGNLDRELITQLGTLHAQLLRCNDTI